MMSLPEIEHRNREVKADVDARVLQAERAKLADKYEKCFRKIMRLFYRARQDGNDEDFRLNVRTEIEKVYKP